MPLSGDDCRMVFGGPGFWWPQFLVAPVFGGPSFWWPQFLVGVHVAHCFSLCVLSYYVLSSMFWCPLQFPHWGDLRFIFVPVVCRGWGYCLCFGCVWLCIVVSDTYCVVFFFSSCVPVLPNFLDCPFLLFFQYFLTFIY